MISKLIENFKAARKFKTKKTALELNRSIGKSALYHPMRSIGIEPTSYCNLLCQFCAYKDKEIPKVTMTEEFFAGVVKQISVLGFVHVDLTPLTGDVFMDKGFLKKMEILENTPSIQGYSFYTNLLAPDEKTLSQLNRFRKLEYVGISIYGSDLDSFSKLTQKKQKQYERIKENLIAFTKLQKESTSPIPLTVAWRFTKDFDPNLNDSEIKQLIEDIRPFASLGVEHCTTYNNWGGMVTQHHLRDVNVDLRSGNEKPRVGPCALLLQRVLVMANGKVNACACRDVNGTLNIGDLNTQPLGEIISKWNPKWMVLLTEQINDKHRTICSNCDYYRSVFEAEALPDPTTYGAFKSVTLDEAVNTILASSPKL